METQTPGTDRKPGGAFGDIKTGDRRVQRTRRLLQDALVGLITEKGYDAITVQDIIDRANVGRSTFYAHFLDKNDLFRSGLDQLRQDLRAQQERLLNTPRDAAHPVPPGLLVTLPVFEHAQAHRVHHKALSGKGGAEVVTSQVYQHLIELLREHPEVVGATTAGPDNPEEIPPELQLHFIAVSLQTLVIWWLDHDLPYSAEQMNRWFHQLVMQPAMSALSGGAERPAPNHPDRAGAKGPAPR